MATTWSRSTDCRESINNHLNWCRFDSSGQNQLRRYKVFSEHIHLCFNCTAVQTAIQTEPISPNSNGFFLFLYSSKSLFLSLNLIICLWENLDGSICVLSMVVIICSLFRAVKKTFWNNIVYNNWSYNRHFKFYLERHIIWSSQNK